MRILKVGLLLTFLVSVLAAASTLDVYTVDVEGGKCVLFVSPSGESLLIDVGWPAFNARPASTDRILEAVKAAGLRRIDHLLISHFDIDHRGDVPALEARFPIGHIYDHGEMQFPTAVTTEKSTKGLGSQQEWFKAYDAVRRKVGHTVLKPGDRIPFQGVDIQVVAAAGQLIQKPLPGAGAPNPLCSTNPQQAVIERDVEDNLSVGLLVTFGTFRMLDLADLEAHHSHELVCPNNLIGAVDVYHVNVHGQIKGIAPELIGALHARVAIMGNGATKGGDPQSWPILRATAGLEDIWQVHYSANGTKDTNPPDDFIANLEPTDEYKSIKLSVESNGTFTVTNTRNGFSKTYQPRSGGSPAPAQPGQAPGRGRAAAAAPIPIVVANDKIELTTLANGGSFSKLLLREGEPLSPFGTGVPHMLALDGFGAPSAEEAALGMPFHGETGRQTFKIVATHESGPVHSVVMQATLPLAQEVLTRTIELADGESVVRVTSDLESLLSVDRPISWTEHATIGPPFLEKGKVVVDMPATHCRVRPYKPGSIPGHLVYDQDFTWPMAPTVDGGRADLRVIPTDHNWLDLASCQLDPARKLEFVTALQLEKHLVFGYVFRREDYPWLMSWMNFTGDNRAARGMEFSTQTFDISHRETVAMSPLFGTPTFRWLPAKSKIQTRFLMFYTRVPEGFNRIDNVTFESGKITILDHSGKSVVLAASQGL
jgi:beta-lactamase superfamily II metal-dependent hydrolase